VVERLADRLDTLDRAGSDRDDADRAGAGRDQEATASDPVG
jgi:hypothetical protein